MTTPSGTLVASMTVLALLVGAAFPLGLYVALRRLGWPAAGARRAALLAAVGTTLWMSATYAAAASGRLAFGPMPPPVAVLFILIVIGATSLGLSRVGARLATGLPLAALVGVQSFRLPLEVLVLHRAYTEGLMPVQMSYSGLNFDVVTGASAIVVALLLGAGRMPRRGVWLWNAVGSLLLLNIMTIAWLSTPTPLRVFMNEPANVWITQPPFIWVPAVMVFAALFGHIVVFRRLLADRRRTRSVGAVAPAADARSARLPA